MKILNRFIVVACIACLFQACSIYTSEVPLSEKASPIDQSFIGKWEAIDTSKPNNDSSHIFVDIINTVGDSNAYMFTYTEQDDSFRDTIHITVTESTVSNIKILTLEVDEKGQSQFHFGLYKTIPDFEVSLIDEANFVDSLGETRKFDDSDSLRTYLSNKLNQTPKLKIAEHFILRKR